MKALPFVLLPLFAAACFAQTSGGPAVPVGFGMTANSSDSITLGWLRPQTNDATGYNLYTGDKADGAFTKLKSVTDRSVTLTGLKPGTTYYYKIAATNASGESALSPPLGAFTIAPWKPQPFPFKIARNMCVTLGSEIVCDAKPLAGEITNLVDGRDSTGVRLRKNCEIRIKLNPNISIADAEYLLVHFRTDCGTAEWSNDKQIRTLRKYVILGSSDSTNGKDGTWRELAEGANDLLDGVIRIANHKPKWIAVRSSYIGKEEVPKTDDRRLMPSDMILARLDVFRSPPPGFRNDYWIFTGDSLVVQDMPAGSFPQRFSFFSDIIRTRFPDRYPIVVHAARGGEMLKDTLPRTEKALVSLNPDNGTQIPTATIVCWESGYNDVGVGGSLGTGAGKIKQYEEAFNMCKSKGLVMVPARIEYSLQYINPETLEPANGNVFVNSLAVNLGGVDVFARTFTPYACDPKTQMPYADYWSYTRQNYSVALVKDGVHHTPEGADGINRLWAEAAEKMIYAPQAEMK